VIVRAVVFDFDGVIANSEPLHFRAFRDVLAERGLVITEAAYYGKYLGFDDLGTFAAIGRDQGMKFTQPQIAEMVASKAVRLEALEQTGSVLFPGARGAIERMARACPIAIASGALRAEILRVLDQEHLTSFFRVVVAAEDTPVSKPAPDPYLRAVERLSEALGGALHPSDCVAVEDSRWGLESARTAGLRTIAVTHTYPAAQLSADAIVPHLDALTWEFLQQLDGQNPPPHGN
jgi:beta-phosphoglucomutase